MICKFKAIAIKVSLSYLVYINKMSLVFIQRGERPRIANTALKKKNRVKGLIQLNFKTCCKAALINTCGIAEGIDK